MEDFIERYIAAFYAQPLHERARALREEFEQRLDAFTARLVPCLIAVYKALGEQALVGVFVQDFPQVHLCKRLMARGFVVLALTPNRGTPMARCCRNGQIPLYVDYLTGEEAAVFQFDAVVAFDVYFVQWVPICDLGALRASYCFFGGRATKELIPGLKAEQTVDLDEQ